MESLTGRLDETEIHMLLRINTSNLPAAIMTEPSNRGKPRPTKLGIIRLIGCSSWRIRQLMIHNWWWWWCWCYVDVDVDVDDDDDGVSKDLAPNHGFHIVSLDRAPYSCFNWIRKTTGQINVHVELECSKLLHMSQRESTTTSFNKIYTYTDTCIYTVY